MADRSDVAQGRVRPHLDEVVHADRGDCLQRVVTAAQEHDEQVFGLAWRREAERGLDVAQPDRRGRGDGKALQEGAAAYVGRVHERLKSGDETSNVMRPAMRVSVVWPVVAWA